MSAILQNSNILALLFSLVVSTAQLPLSSCCCGQGQDTGAATTPEQFRVLARSIEAETNQEYFSARENLAKKALALAEEDLKTANAESLLHWILSGKTDSPAGHKAAQYLIEHHATSRTSVRRLLSYAQAPSGCTPELFAGFTNADLPNDLRWIVSACNAIHQKSLLLIADELALNDAGVSRFDLSLGQELAERLTNEDLRSFESRVIEDFRLLSKQHGKQNMGGISVKELSEGSIFEVQHLRLGKTAKDLSGESVNGDAIDLETFRGKVVLVDFWATWCAPCVSEMPKIRELYNELDKHRFQILGVSADKDKDELIQYIKAHELQWPNIFDRDGELQKRWHALSLPSFYVLDETGIVRYRGDNHRFAAAMARTILGLAPEGVRPSPSVAEVAKAAFEMFDQNKNQQMERSEMPDEMKPQLDKADKDKNGSLSLTELSNFLRDNMNVTHEVVSPTTPQ